MNKKDLNLQVANLSRELSVERINHGSLKGWYKSQTTAYHETEAKLTEANKKLNEEQQLRAAAEKKYTALMNGVRNLVPKDEVVVKRA